MPEENNDDPQKVLRNFWNCIEEFRIAIGRLNKYKGNNHYKQAYDKAYNVLNKEHKYLHSKILRTRKPQLIEKFNFVNGKIESILGDTAPEEKLANIKDLEKYWPELEIELENIHLSIRSFELPEEIPMAEYRLDAEEAIKDFDNGCFISSLVLCRRAYEGALVTTYRSKEGKDPYEETKCQNCKATLRARSYLGIAKLHAWAIEKGLITDRLKQVGFLLSDMGAGGAHPPLQEFSRDSDMARLQITATIALLKEIHTKKQAPIRGAISEPKSGA